MSLENLARGVKNNLLPLATNIKESEALDRIIIAMGVIDRIFGLFYECG